MKTHDALEIADHLIRKGLDNDNALTPLQVIKLVYFCHGWMLGLYGRPLCTQEVRAWIYGPVIPDVYHELKVYGGSEIMVDMGMPNPELDEYEDDLVKQVYDKYGRFSGVDLSRRTHAPGTPWHKIWKRKGRNAVIPNPLIQKYYAGIAEASS